MQIPLKCLITDQMARNTPIGRRLQKVSSQLTVPNHCQVIVYMLMTRARGDSFFQPYYDVLPEDFNNFPIFWDHEALGWLEGSVLVQQIKDRKANIRSDYDAICHALPEFRRFSFKEFLWCRTAVGSRNFSIVVRGEKRTAMVPQADMLNHLRPRECSWTFDNAANSFVITSLTKIPKGAQVNFLDSTYNSMLPLTVQSLILPIHTRFLIVMAKNATASFCFITASRLRTTEKQMADA